LPEIKAHLDVIMNMALTDRPCLTISHVNGSMTFNSFQMFFHNTISSKYTGCSMLLHLTVEISTNQQGAKCFGHCVTKMSGLLSTRTKHSNWWIYCCFQRQVFRQTIQSNEIHEMGVVCLRSRRLFYRLHLCIWAILYNWNVTGFHLYEMGVLHWLYYGIGTVETGGSLDVNYSAQQTRHA